MYEYGSLKSIKFFKIRQRFGEKRGLCPNDPPEEAKWKPKGSNWSQNGVQRGPKGRENGPLGEPKGAKGAVHRAPGRLKGAKGRERRPLGEPKGAKGALLGVALGLTWGTLALIFSGLILDVFFGTLFKGCLIVFDAFSIAHFSFAALPVPYAKQVAR